MKISIIGSNGFISNSILGFLKNKEVTIDLYGRTKPTGLKFDNFYEIDLFDNDFATDKILDSDIIFYAAGAGIQSNLKQSEWEINKLNLVIPINIDCYLKSKKFIGTFITFGSYFEIGENLNTHLFTEEEIITSPGFTNNKYAISKRLLTRYVDLNQYDYQRIHFILPTIYGENESEHRLIPYVINSLKSATEIKFTSGEQIRQYLYIEELIKMIFMAVEKKISSGIYNTAGSEIISVRQIVEKLFDLFKKNLPDSVFGKAERLDVGMKVLQLDGSKLAKAIDYTATIEIKDIYEKY